MTMRMGRKIPNWVLLVAGGSVVAIGLLLSVLAKPLPEYLVAATDLKPGVVLTDDDFERVSLNLGDLSNYLRADELPNENSLLRVLRKGELLSALDLTSEVDPEFTAIRVIPKLQPAGAKVGSFVAVWQGVEAEDGSQIERLVARAEVLEIEYGEGLFADRNPEVELRVRVDEAVLVMRAIAEESLIFVVPVQ